MGKQQFLFIGLLYILSLYNALALIQHELIAWFLSPSLRQEIDTHISKVKVSQGEYIKVGFVNNTRSNKPYDYSFTYSVANTRNYSAGQNISTNVLRKELNATIGGELSYKKIVPLTGKKIIPAHKVGFAYIRSKITTVTFNHTIQIQMLYSGEWENRGPAKTSISIVNTTSYELKIDY